MPMRTWMIVVPFVVSLGLGCGGGGSSTPTDSGTDVDEDVTDGGEVGEAGDGGDVDDAIEDTGDVDDVGDVEDVEDGTEDDAAKHTAITLTAGGTESSSANYRLRMFVGTPQPMGTGETDGGRASFGPGTTGNQ